MKEETINDTLYKTELIQLPNKLFKDKPLLSEMRFLAIRIISIVIIIYIVRKWKQLKQSTKIYSYLLLWNLFLCFLLSMFFLLITLNHIPHGESINAFMLRSSTDQLWARTICLVAFLPSLVVLFRYVVNDVRNSMLRCTFRILIFTFTYMFFYVHHYSICWSVATVYLWLINNCGLLCTSFIMHFMFFIILISIANISITLVGKWRNEERRITRMNIYKSIAKTATKLIRYILLLLAIFSIILSAYTIVNCRTVMRLFDIDGLVGANSNLRKISIGMVFSDTNRYLINLWS
ncbi:hypothetical protein NEFER03_1020 [Nematocida sp. LUAm3]|nr:hypothetical protein NEFER03_1020 [Nematocida sp. LUAm3]KAI5175376.1 hypothetical protein NEFER02_1305 [Nematocida sp. LUAm2]KAI5177667.1 hypothetical protein NEFER01_0891 [Nematocida sp. LUAm1]